MTQYNTNDLEGWEFKIVRSTMGRFRNQEVVRRLVAEEAQNGWEMLEKFDDYRIRFKRRIDKRALHSGGNIDPYRTNFGVGNAVMPIIGAFVALLLVGVLFLTRESGKPISPMVLMIIVAAFIALVMVMLILRRK